MSEDSKENPGQVTGTLPDNSSNEDGDGSGDSDDEPEDITAKKQAPKDGAVKKILKDFKRRKASVYAFFFEEPVIEFEKDDVMPEYLVLTCSHCAIKVKQGLQTGDKGSTGIRESYQSWKKCWGDEAVNAAKESTLDKAREAVKMIGKKSQTKLTSALKVMKTWAKTFSTCPPEMETIRVVTARWVAENARPFLTVQDQCFRWLQKEGCPNHYIPSKETVAKDVKILYKRTKEKLATELQMSEYKLGIALDTWTSPNPHVCM
ncbi:hypothetical protein FB446DRAFT_708560 [Lentinula raphanica]|nr:hypothetical protein FB446DRAFT_708560 [Lentinula raphanica]